MSALLSARIWDAPPVKPSLLGLYGHVSWLTDPDPDRMLLHGGIKIRPHNYGGDTAVDDWSQDNFALSSDDITDLKTGSRPDISSLTAFVAKTVYAFDKTQAADIRDVSLTEVRARASHNLELLEQGDLESALGTRLMSDAGTPSTATSLAEAVGILETKIALTGTTGAIHASPAMASLAAQDQILIGSFPNYTTALGNQWVFGGGYDDPLGTTLVATSPVYGWRTGVLTSESLTPLGNVFIAVAERSVLLGYEKFIAAATIS